jgi:hypothetical protein
MLFDALRPAPQVGPLANMLGMRLRTSIPSIADDPPPSVTLHVSTEDLNRATQLLRQNGPVLQHAKIYQSLVVERYRRRLEEPANEIRLARETFEALPREVQLILTAES